jgi:hypothetical protein
MAESLTFTSLKTDLNRYAERGASATLDADVFNQIPRLINLAERRCADELKILGFQEVVTNDMVSGTSVYEKPDRWRQTISINFGTGVGNTNRTPLYPRSYEYCRSYWPDEATTGQPEFYSDYDFNNWLFAPTPNAAHPFEVLYYQLPPLLDDANETNWLTEYAPNLILYAALLEMSPFLKHDERIPTWQANYDRAAQALNGMDIQRMLDRSVRRTAA